MRFSTVLLLFAVLLLAACDGDDEPPTATATGTPALTVTAAGTNTASPTSTPSATSSATPSATTSTPAASPSAIASLASLHGLRCIGQWTNQASGTSGAFAVRVEAGGGGGLLSFEIGGAPFGGAGGVFEAPFQLQGTDLVIEADSEFLGHVSARIGLDGSGDATLDAPPALGPGSRATMTAYEFANDVLHFTMQVDPGAGQPAHTSVVEAACAKAR